MTLLDTPEKRASNALFHKAPAPSDLTTAGWVTGTGGDQPEVIRIDALRKSYDSRKFILDGVSLSVRAGEQVALIGANGCGKSTLLKCLIGLHPVTAGSVRTLDEQFSFEPTRAARAGIRRQTGFVFQKHCLVRRRSVLSNVIHGMLGSRGSWRGFSHTLAPAEWRERAFAALEEMNLADKAMQRVDTLSGGQQQRVAIARALMRRPKLVIADEPAASLDPASGRAVMQLFARRCRDYGITLLFTSHDMQDTREFADRIVALRSGKVFFDKPSSAVTDEDLRETFSV